MLKKCSNWPHIGNGNLFEFMNIFKTGCDTCSRNFDFSFDEFSWIILDCFDLNKIGNISRSTKFNRYKPFMRHFLWMNPFRSSTNCSLQAFLVRDGRWLMTKFKGMNYPLFESCVMTRVIHARFQVALDNKLSIACQTLLMSRGFLDCFWPQSWGKNT